MVDLPGAVPRVPPVSPPAPTPPPTAVAPAPPPPAPPSPVIVAAGDIADDADNPGDDITAQLIDGIDPTAVLALGDLVYESGTLAEFETWYHPTWGRHKPKTYPVPGNHEYETPGAAGYFDYFNGTGSQAGPAGDRAAGYYSFDVGSWHVIALNSVCDEVGGCEADSPQEQWLRRDLAAHQNACTLAFWHHPRFTSGGHGEWMHDIWQALYEGNADLALVGHEHNYERFAPQDAAGGMDPARGIRQLVVGTGGHSRHPFVTVKPNSEVRNASTFGVLELTLRSGAYDWAFRPAGGASFNDSGSSRCH